MRCCGLVVLGHCESVALCRSLSVGRCNLIAMLVDYFVRSVIGRSQRVAKGRSQRVGRRGLVAVGWSLFVVFVGYFVNGVV